MPVFAVIMNIVENKDLFAIKKIQGYKVPFDRNMFNIFHVFIKLDLSVLKKHNNLELPLVQQYHRTSRLFRPFPTQRAEKEIQPPDN